MFVQSTCRSPCVFWVVARAGQNVPSFSAGRLRGRELRFGLENRPRGYWIGAAGVRVGLLWRFHLKRSCHKGLVMVTHPGTKRRLPRTSLRWKAALLMESPVRWEKALHVLIMLRRADGFTVTSWVFFALKAPTNGKCAGSPCVGFLR